MADGAFTLKVIEGGRGPAARRLQADRLVTQAAKDLSSHVGGTDGARLLAFALCVHLVHELGIAPATAVWNLALKSSTPGYHPEVT